MTSEKNKAIVIATFSITFMLIGWMSPVLFATYAPQGQIIEANSFTANNATTTSDSHMVCFDRTVSRPAAGQTFTELYLINDNSGSTERTEIAFEITNRYYQEGRSQVATPLNLPNQVVEGKYRYLLVVQMELADGRVTRAFTFKSEPFYIKDELDKSGTSKTVCQ